MKAAKKAKPIKATPKAPSKASAKPAKPVKAAAKETAKGSKAAAAASSKAAPKAAPKAAGKKSKASDDAWASDPWSPGRVCVNPCADKSCQTLIEATGYCRLLYIKNWTQIQKKKQILAAGQLDRYIKEIVDKYPEKYVEVIREDLSSPVAFARVVDALELSDETNEGGTGESDEELEDIIENVKVEVSEDPFD